MEWRNEQNDFHTHDRGEKVLLLEICIVYKTVQSKKRSPFFLN